MEKFNFADAEIIVRGYDDRAEIKGKKVVIKNFFQLDQEMELTQILIECIHIRLVKNFSFSYTS